MEVDENSSGSQSDQSEDIEENGQPMDEDYDEQVPDYSIAYSSGSRPHGVMDDETDEEDEDAEGDAEGDEDGEDDDVNHAAAADDDEMDEDDDIGDDGDDGGDGVEANADEDEGATSYSSEYSE